MAAPGAPPGSADVGSLLAGYRAASQPDSVESVVERLLPAAVASSDSALHQILLLERGKTRVAYGRAADGEPDLQDARIIAEARGDGGAVRDALRYLSEAYRQTGRGGEAEEVLGELNRRSLATGDNFHVGKALHGLGRLRLSARDLAAAESVFAEALPFATAANDSAGLAALYNSLGNCLGARGEYRGAGTNYALAADLARAGDSHSLEAMARNNLAGVAMILGDPAAAVDEYRRARDIQIERGLGHQAGAPWRNLAQALKDLGHLDDADRELTAALAFSRDHGYPEEEALALVRLASLDLAMGEHNSALERSREAIALRDAISPATRLEAHLRAVDALLKLDRIDEIWTGLESAEAELAGREDYTLSMLLAQSKGRALRAAGRHVEALSALRGAISRSTAAGTPRHSMPLLVTAAASWYELGEADSALAYLDAAESVWKQDRVLPTDPAWRERRGIEAQQLFALRVALAMREGDLEQGFAALQRFKARTLLERILGPGILPEQEMVPEPVTLVMLQRKVLRPGELFLDMMSGPGGGWLFAVTPEACLAWPLAGDDEWSTVLDPLLGQVAHPFGDFDERTAEAVFEALLGATPGDSAAFPVQAAQGRGLIAAVRTILVSPDGVLHRIPFSVVLPAQDIRRVPSATILAHLRGQQAHDGETAGRILAVAGLENASHARLAGATAEVRRLQRRFRHVTVAGGSGTRGTRADRTDEGGSGAGGEGKASRGFAGIDPAGYGLLHLACHGEVDAQRPWNSAIYLGGPRGVAPIRAGDVAGMELNARLAVLSSCGSADGRILAGEGVQGLAAAFLTAGVPAVVATLWAVDDGTTARFMDHFYDGLAAGASPAWAIADARTMLASDVETSHPFFWAGLVLIGDGESQPDLYTLRPHGGRIAAWLAGIVAILAVAVLAWRRSRPDRKKLNSRQDPSSLQAV